MPDYYLAPSLAALRDEIDARWPKRDKASDGWIGDTSHQSRKSDHNPDWAAGGVVRALDVDVDGIDRIAVLNELIGDPRVWYVISNRVIYSRTYGWQPRRYTGSNPHDRHLHVSILHTRQAENDLTPWFAPTKPRDVGLPNVSLRVVRAQAKRPTGAFSSVRRVQRALNERYELGLELDGWFGKSTRAAYLKHERSTNAPATDGIPGAISLRELVHGIYEVVNVR